MSRLLVAMDTATDAIALGVARLDGQVVHEIAGGYEIAVRRANSQLLPALSKMMATCGERVVDIEGVIVGRGPGSFTGVRIGVATAKGLAQGRGVPLVGVGTLDAIAWRFATDHDGLLGVVGDAMRGEVYPALFRITDGMAVRLSEDRVVRPAEGAALWADEVDEPVLLTGNGLAKHAETFLDALGDRAEFAGEDLWWPSGPGLFSAFKAGGGSRLLEFADPGGVLPIYTRLSDAEETERERVGRGPQSPPSSGVAGGEAR